MIERMFCSEPVGRTPTTAPPGAQDQVLADLRQRLSAADGGGSSGTLDAGLRSGWPGPVGRPGVLGVPAPLAAALPHGGLPRGGVVSLLGDQGVTSLLFTLLAAPAPNWAAVVGVTGIGLAAAAELGVDLDRLVVIPDPGPDVLQVVSVLADGVDRIAIAAPTARQTTPARVRVVTGRLRQRGAVLLVAGRWPGADLVLTAQSVVWTGLGVGHGRLRDRELVVTVGGRRSAGSGRVAALYLQGTRVGVQVLAGSGAVAAGAAPGARAAVESDRALIADAV